MAHVDLGGPKTAQNDSGRPQSRSGTPGDRRSRRRLQRLISRCFPFAAALADFAVVVAATAAISVCYKLTLPPRNDLAFGALIAVAFLAINALRHNYTLLSYLDLRRQTRRVLRAWSLAFVLTITMIFLTKTGGYFSRGMAVLVFGIVAIVNILVRVGLRHVLLGLAERGEVAARTIFIVGEEAALRAFTRRPDATGPGHRVAGSAVIRPDPVHRTDDLDLAAAAARVMRPDDILILAPWRDSTLIGHCIATFRRLPAAVHLGPDALLENFADMHVVRNGPLTCVRLVHTPLSPLEQAVKRGFDLFAGGILLVLLSPLFLIVAALVKYDSPGPVFFRQTRYGFNREPFRIAKFRTMRTLEDGAAVRQATKNDPRITRIGHLLRRTNIDELPQLWNVLMGDMSLVGPRPHAMAHDQAFDGKIVDYSRRHNMRPGITGLAQVNGWRGETGTPDKMAGRIALDLEYVDDWSLWLDVQILAKTVLSASAYRNAG